MVAARAAVNPSMSPGQQKLMQYLPVVFAVFQIFFLLGLVVYYIVQAILRIIQQYYITRRFYHGEESLGRQAQAAGVRARELANADGGGGGMFAQAKRDMANARESGASTRPGGKPTAKANKADKANDAKPAPTSKRTTAPKSRPTPSANKPTGRPGQRPSSAKKRRRS
jgi:YidC/Oxa1 family membrane protein insertase